MKKLLAVIDMQNDFVDGALGSKEARAIVPAVTAKVRQAADEGTAIVFTRDTHHANYMDTKEGHYLPVMHCQEGTWGWEIIDELRPYADVVINKPTFGSTELVEYVKNGDYDVVEFIGLCTDICVVSNALLLKAHLPELTYMLDPACCAGVTPQAHEAALETMKSCQIEIVTEEDQK